MLGKTLLVVAASLAVGFTAAGRVDRDRGADRRATAAVLGAEPLAFDRSLPLEQRMHALEQMVSEERSARQLLQEEVLFLTGELEQLTAAARSADGTISPEAVVQSEERRSSTRSSSPEDRAGQLQQAGFTAGEAEWIARRESELTMAALQARYDAGRSGDASAWWQGRGEIGEALRAELGDAGYERYLEANGRSTSVTVGAVIESSPAERAGLLPGDRITRYGGERIFSMSELSRQTMDGAPGQPVVVDIVRGGLPMQVVIPRGPLGISGGQRFDGG